VALRHEWFYEFLLLLTIFRFDSENADKGNASITINNNTLLIFFKTAGLPEFLQTKEKIMERICSECGKEMSEGFVINNGMEYFCCEECLHKHYSHEEYLEMYDNGEGESY